MQQSFVKAISGNDVEFNRLLYPVRYKVILRVSNQNPFEIIVKKAGDKILPIEDESSFPDWVKPMLPEILGAIGENEKASVGTLN